jgi:membrane-associated protein
MYELWELITNADEVLFRWVEDYGVLCYLLFALMVFAETGLIVTPFLPGDGLLFSAGLIASQGALDVTIGSTQVSAIILLVPLLFVAAVLGNLLNYKIGNLAGHRLVKWKNKLFQKYLASAHEFYEKHGRMAIIFARFFPIFRTYVPFVAGIAEMRWHKFVGSTLLGAAIWVPLFLLCGFFLGNIPWVRDNYGLIFLVLIIVTLIPFGLTILREIVKSLRQRRARKRALTSPSAQNEVH